MISFIVSVYDRPWNLNILLPLLELQGPGPQLIVCGNHRNSVNYHTETLDITPEYYPTWEWRADGSGYDSANAVCERGIPKGDWLCFPSDDSLYVADFSRIMLETAARENAGFVYCDCLYKQGSVQGNWPAYSVLDVSPRIGRIDKTCFIVRRELFHGFPPHPQDYRDGALAEQLVARGVKSTKAPGVLVVHQ